MISVFAPLETTFTGNGEAVLTPLSGTVRQAAGGEYSFTMEHHLDPWGKWKHLKREAIIRLPVPKETIENSYTGIEADIYKTNTDAPLRSGTTEPSTITYNTWSQYNTYSVGSKVTSLGKNYECIYWDGASTYRAQSPGASTWWKEIARNTPGDPVLVNLKSGTELYLDSTYSDTTWYRMTTTYGVIGYIKKSQVTYDRHSSASENGPRTITEQLFRIKEVNVNRDQGTVSVSGVHVSYDLNGNIVEDMELYDVSVAMAISRISNGLQLSYPGMISTNMTSDSLGKFTGKFKRKNGMFCLADPDTGIVKHYEAKFTRDNWDLFVMTNTETDRGYAIRYAKNVNGINWKEKTDKLITRVMPVAKAEDGTDLYLPEKWVSSSHVSDYPVIYMETLNVTGQVGKDDGTGTDTVWTEANLLTEMRTKAGERFSVNKIDLPVVEVTVQLEALEGTEEYKWLKDLLQVQLYDKVTVTDPDIGNSQSLTVDEIEYDIIKKKISGVKLSSGTGDVSRTVTGYDIKNGSVTSNKLSGEVYDGLMSDMKGLIPDFTEPFVESSHMNSASQDGLVKKGSGQASKVWKTDANGNPDWRAESGAIDIIDNLTSTRTDAALSANQGKALNDKMHRLSAYLENGDNANDAVDFDYYYMISVNTTGVLNSPGAGYTIFPIQNGWGVVQVAVYYYSSKIKTRVKFGTHWSEWVTIVNS